MTIYLFVGFAVLFAVSVLSLAYVQTQIIARGGWRALQARSYREMRKLYWDDVSVLQRWFIYPGLVAFVVVSCIAVDSLLFTGFHA